MYTLQHANEVTGTIDLSGSKNATLPIMVASCLCDEKITLTHVPMALRDVQVLLGILQDIGFCIGQADNESLIYDPQHNSDLSWYVSDKGSNIRYSLLLLSLLLQKCGNVQVTKPGGCNFGERKYDIHLDSLRKMGAEILEDENYIRGTLKDAFNGRKLLFHTATTSGTENILIAASKAHGNTIVENAHTCPEVQDLMHFLRYMGSHIEYRTRYINIEGVSKLTGGAYTIMSDKDEAITYMILAAITRGSIRIRNFTTHNLRSEVNLLREIGVTIEEREGDILVDATNRTLHPFHLSTAPYPGIVDAQPLFAALAMTIEGESIITEMRHMGRFQYVEEFRKFGADIDHYYNCVIIRGGSPLHGARVIAPDLRAGAALMLLGCVAKGETVIENEVQIERGYSSMVEKMNQVGCRGNRS